MSWAQEAGGLRGPCPHCPALDVECFKDLSSVFHPVTEWRRESLRALASFGRVGREEALISAMVAEFYLKELVGSPLVSGFAAQAVGGHVVEARDGAASLGLD